LRRELAAADGVLYALTQVAAGILGVWTAHLMFEVELLQLSARPRTGAGQWLGEAVATFGLVLTILGAARRGTAWVPPSVALYISAAYWFTSSTSFANPAITLARGLSDSFAGIAPSDVPAFVAAQLAGALLAAAAARGLFR
jgi:glycerol uptake facilitator-like aquaporin